VPLHVLQHALQAFHAAKFQRRGGRVDGHFRRRAGIEADCWPLNWLRFFSQTAPPMPTVAASCASKMDRKNFQNKRPKAYSLISW
jgi:hypothetical protein